MIYLDNAATSFPKPSGVSERMKEYIDQIGAPVNRSVYRSAQQVGMEQLRLRERLMRLLGFKGSPTHVLLFPGATAALNQAIAGFLQPGEHCLVSSMEHNAVMRPLVQMEKQGISFDRIPCGEDGSLLVSEIEPLIRPNTKLLIMAHASNVCGTVQNAQAVGEICKRRNIAFVLDAAQTAGHYPIDFEAFHLSAVAVPGHKGLLGPSGIGALLVRDEFAKALTPIIAGGTGSASDSELLPRFLPDRFEPGTPNLPGIYGWESALEFVEKTGVAALHERETALTAQLLDRLRGLEGLRICGREDINDRVGVVSLDFLRRDNAEVAQCLETEYGILTRCGLHCAPAAHKTLKTFPHGTVRFSIGAFTSSEDIEAAAKAICALK